MVIFGAGVVTGGLLVRSTLQGRDRRPQHAVNAVRPAQPTSAGGTRIDLLRRLEQELNLTAEQREPIDKILKEGQERMKKLMETVEPHRREVLKQTIEEFRAVPTPEQQRRFDDLLKQQQQRGRELRKAPPPRERPLPPPPSGTPSGPTNS